MKIAIYADTHHRGQDLADGLAVQTAAFRAMTRAGADLVLDAGDTFDRAQIGDRHAFPGTVLAGYLDAVRWLESPLHVIEGNHTLGRPGQHGPLAALGAHPRVTVWTRPGVHRVDNVAIAMLPWASKLHFVTRPEIACLPAEDQTRRFHEACRAILVGLREDSRWEEAGYRILLGHAEVSGATTPHGYILEGETFRFAGSDLAQTGANLVALGHYHKRQQIPGCPNGWYVGALRQLNFGEQGNPTGFLVVDTSTGELDWREVDCPRYYTIPVEEFRPELHQTTDRIKLRGAVPPAELPANAIFEAVTAQREAQVRIEAIDPGADIPTLLGHWASANAEQLDIATLAPLLAELSIVEQAHRRGSIDRLIEIRLAGIGPHRDTHVSLESGDWWAICGHNGCGKTLLLEAPIACWFGCWAHPKRPSLYSLMTEEHAILEVVWESGGQRYRMTRKLRQGKTQKHEAYLVRLDGPKSVELAGPKVVDAEQEVAKIVGSKDDILASIWLTQKAEGDLISEDPAGRKRLMRRWINVDRFDPMAEQCKGQAANLDGALRVQEAELASRPGKETFAKEQALRLTELLAEDEDLARREDGRQRVVQALREQAAELLAKQANRLELERKVSACQDEVSRQGIRVRQLQDRMKEQHCRLEAEESLRTLVAQIPDAKKQLGEIQRVQQRNAERRACQAELNQKRERELAAIKIEKSKIERVIESGAQDIARLKADLEKVKGKADRLQTVGCAKTGILPCRLIDDHVAEIDRLPEMQQAIDEKQRLLDGLELTLLEQNFARQERARIVHLDAELAAIPAEEPVLDPRPLEKLLRDLEQAERDLTKLEEVRRAADQTGADLNCAMESCAEAVAQLDQAKLALAESAEVDLAATRAELAKAERALANCQTERLALAGQLGATKQQLEAIQQQLAELDELEKTVAQDRARRDGWRLLERAFGRDGIPQLLISSAIPAIQSILDEVCAVDFQGRFTLRLDTLRQTKTAGTKEDFSILLGCNGREYDASGASGGEEAAARAAMRTALVLYQATRAGDGYKMVALDEPAAHQDAENALATLAMVDRLRGRFQQMLIVSHSDEMLSGFPHRIALEKGPRGTRVADQEPIKTEEAIAA